MKPTDSLENRWFKSSPQTAVAASSHIDAENGIIRRVVLAQSGEAKGHGVHLEKEFIEDLVKVGSRDFAKNGLKARFGHPSMSSETMGTQLGFFKNFEVDGEAAVADLHLLAAANDSPTHPGMKNWVLKMAGEKPDHIMSSIVFRPGGYYQRELESRKKRKLKRAFSEDRGAYWSNYDESLGPVYVELGELYFTDLVEDGAATDNLFSAQFNQEKFAVQVAGFLREQPHLLDFLQNKPEKTLDFLRKIGVNHFQLKPKQKSMTSLKDFFAEFFGKPVDTEQSDFEKAFAKAEAAIAQLNQKITDQATELSTLKDSLKTATEQLSKANAKIVALEAEPAGEHVERETEPPAAPDPAKYGSVTQKAIALAAKNATPKIGGGYFR